MTPGAALTVRLDARASKSVLEAIDESWRVRISDSPPNREFLADTLATLYNREEREAAALGIFAGVAIVLSCLGLVSMAAFSAQRQRKEIAIRKVLGARNRDILGLLAWQFSKPVLLSNLAAWPVAWVLARHWLDGFAYRIDIPVLAFIGASLAALAVAAAAIGLQTLKVARSRPILMLRHD
ncbi:ABC transporter permease [Nitrospirillum sp. BR 11163]|uniref:ABC transporter permease n=1 Tax=Nitrospirillum sp. BR 11163 TaxID=3104323 RepID=UPI002AFF8A43|nr:FtsX-like permease family protein [Nitrospirillum sp. BR 11163]MEA1671949.1 FtsX-like permease family protein [Nitrospirillum sp. BR 11163]